MSVEAMAIALHHSKARGTTKVVLLGIANHDGDAGAFPKVATLAKYANVHPRRVQAAIAELAAMGEITVETKQGGMRSIPDHLRPNLYQFTLACPRECDRTKNHRIANEKIGRRHKGSAPVDKSADLETKTSPGDENVSTPGDENVSTPGDENVSTKNRKREPSLEPGGFPSPSTSPGDLVFCWSCGLENCHPDRRYCETCTASGMNNALVPCSGPGCNTVTRRTFPGQQTFDCGMHHEGDDFDG